MIRVVEGARDLLPADMLLQKWLSQQIESVLALYGFEPWDSPLLEYRSLYTEHSNEDLVNQQAFTFYDIEGNEVVLRSELTPSLARVVAMHHEDLDLPLRWYSYGPFWRNENLVPGRGREFRQWNIDTVGIPEPVADVELVLQAIHHLENFGFKDSQVVIKMNNRALLRRNLFSFGIPEELFGRLVRLLDRASKSKQVDFYGEAERCGCSLSQLQALEDYLQDDSLWKEDELLSTIFDAAEKLGRRAYLQYEPKIIRFPLYYTGLVFEAFDRQGLYPAILGGGRYDLLIQNVGGFALPAAGFAIGNITLVELMRDKGLLPHLKNRPPVLLAAAAAISHLPHVTQLAQELRLLGYSVEVSPQIGARQHQLDYARLNRVPLVAFLPGTPHPHATVELIDTLNQNHQLFDSLPEVISHFANGKRACLAANGPGLKEWEKEVTRAS